jgi:signal transduction histidine kinase
MTNQNGETLTNGAKLAATVGEIAERERTKFAAELHDTIGAEATSLTLLLQQLNGKLEAIEQTPTIKEIVELAGKISQRADSIYKLQRDFSSRLRPTRS